MITKLAKNIILILLIYLNKDGTLNENVHEKYIGKNIHTVREELVSDLEKEQILVKKDKYQNTVPIGERTGEIIEPLLTNQWFMSMTNLAQNKA